jgi:hypothetical protein
MRIGLRPYCSLSGAKNSGPKTNPIRNVVAGSIDCGPSGKLKASCSAGSSFEGVDEPIVELIESRVPTIGT